LPPPPPRKRVGPPPHLGPGGEPHSLAGEEGVGPSSDDWTDTLVLFIVIPLCRVRIANSFPPFRVFIFSYFFNRCSLMTSNTFSFQLSLLLFFFSLGIGGIPASIISVRYRTGLSLLWCRTGSGIGLSFYSITGLNAYRTVYGILAFEKIVRREVAQLGCSVSQRVQCRSSGRE
jgi:hypothetical protein